jgi:hypothetical protein
MGYERRHNLSISHSSVHLCTKRGNFRRAPAGPAETRLTQPLLNPGPQGGLLRRGQFGRVYGGLAVWRALTSITAELPEPDHNGLLVHLQDQGHLCRVLTINDRQDSEEILALAHVAEMLGSPQVVLHCFTGRCREGKMKQHIGVFLRP